MGPRRNAPFSGHLSLPKPFDIFFIVKRVSTEKETFHSVSPFLVEKSLTGNIGEVASVRKLRSGDLLVEVSSRQQSHKILKLKSFGPIPVTITPHGSMNSSRGVITCGELFNVPLEEITEKLQNQGVTHVRRIAIRRDGQLQNTKHLILTFHSPKLRDSIKAGYMKLPVRPYIPNPLRCFKCQRFGHSKTNCREHTSFSRDCPAWKLEKEIVTVKVKEQVSFPEARRIVRARTPAYGTSYASAVKGQLKTVGIQYDTKDFKQGSGSDVPVAIVDTESDHNPDFVPISTKRNRKKLRSTSQKSLLLKLSKKNKSKTDVKKLPSFTVKNSVALGLATEGLVQKDLPSLFGMPNSPDHISLHPSEEEEDFSMSCGPSHAQNSVFKDKPPIPLS
ncbi:uncharacterized protein LOC129966457 [Argiope bruennichi]|uniref:uncharacterized protein LOC129966457 n=1 Tax=Argiope bruennichi TaxID=94029 RepID=UPI0024958154|nr:uncharacterized protein LOC129966457 [Argiope bruennichi]